MSKHTTRQLQISDLALRARQLVLLDRAMETGETVSGLRPSAVPWRSHGQTEVTRMAALLQGDVLLCGVLQSARGVFAIVRNGDGIAAILAYATERGLRFWMHTQGPGDGCSTAGPVYELPQKASIGAVCRASRADDREMYIRVPGGWERMSTDG